MRGKRIPRLLSVFEKHIAPLFLRNPPEPKISTMNIGIFLSSVNFLRTILPHGLSNHAFLIRDLVFAEEK